MHLHHGTATPELREKFVMVAPQAPGDWNLQKIDDFLDHLLSSDGAVQLGAKLDPRRIYLTGHSIGGIAVITAGGWLRTGMGLERQPRFAALAPVSMAAPLASPQMLKGIPVWFHHGANDVIAPVRFSDVAFKRLKELNAEAPEGYIRYSRYPESPTAPGRDPRTHRGHAAPILTYNRSALYLWFLEHSNPDPHAQ